MGRRLVRMQCWITCEGKRLNTIWGLTNQGECLLLFLLVTSFISPSIDASAKELDAEVKEVTTGDTLRLDENGKTWMLHLGHIQCPRLTEPLGVAAKERASGFCLNKAVRIRVLEEREGGTLIGDVVLNSGNTLSKELLESGLAGLTSEKNVPTDLLRAFNHAILLEKGIHARTSVPPTEEIKADLKVLPSPNPPAATVPDSAAREDEGVHMSGVVGLPNSILPEDAADVAYQLRYFLVSSLVLSVLLYVGFRRNVHVKNNFHKYSFFWLYVFLLIFSFKYYVYKVEEEPTIPFRPFLSEYLRIPEELSDSPATITGKVLPIDTLSQDVDGAILSDLPSHLRPANPEDVDYVAHFQYRGQNVQRRAGTTKSGQPIHYKRLYSRVIMCYVTLVDLKNDVTLIRDQYIGGDDGKVVGFLSSLSPDPSVLE